MIRSRIPGHPVTSEPSCRRCWATLRRVCLAQRLAHRVEDRLSEAAGLVLSNGAREGLIAVTFWLSAPAILIPRLQLTQRVLMRRGAIGQIRRGRLAFAAEVRSLAHVLGQTVGRTFQQSCDAALGDPRCGVDLEDPAYSGNGTVAGLVGDRGFTASGLDGFASGWFGLGTVE